MAEQYCTIRQLGEEFGVTSHVMGRRLIEVGLRERQGNGIRPTPAAHQGGYCTTTASPHGDGYFYVWHREKALERLRAAGYVPKGDEHNEK